MARVSKNNLKGPLGNLVFYESRGLSLARRRPDRVKQTKATKSAAKDFGRAVRYSRLIRDSLTGLIDPKDKPMMYRLNNELLQWLRESKGDGPMMSQHILRLEGFEFNEDCFLRRRLKVEPVVDFNTSGKILVNIPAMKPSPDIIAPRDTESIEVNIMALRCNTRGKPAIYTDPPEEYMLVHNINYNNTPIPTQQLELPFRSIPGDIVLVVMGLKYFMMKQNKLVQVVEKRWLPAGVVGVSYRG